MTAPERSLAQRIFRDGAIYAVAGAASHGIAFLLFPFFAHVFDPRDYGIIDLLGVLTTLVSLTVALEVAQGLGRHFAELTDVRDQRAYASTAWLFALGTYSAFAVLALALSGPLTRTLLGADVDPLVLRLGVGAMWCYGVGNLAIDLLRWRMRPKHFAIAAVTTTAVVTASSAVYVLALDMGVEGAILGQLTGFAAGGLIGVALNRDLLGIAFDSAALRRMLAYSVPLVPASAGVFLNGYADRIAIQTRLTLADVGLYGVGYRLSVIVSLTLMGFQGALLPQLLRHYRDPGTPLQLARVFRLFCAVALVVLVAVSTLADELLRVLTRPAYYGAADVVPLVVAAAFFAGMYIFAPGLNIAKRTRLFAAVTVAGGIVNLALALVLVEPLGIEGAGLSYLVSQLAAFAVLMRMSQNLYPAPHPWGRLLAGAALAVALTAIGWLLPPVTEELWALPAKLAVCGGAMVALTLLMLDPDERAMGRGWLRARVAGARAASRSGRAA